MGAETQIYVKVLKYKTEIIEVDAVTCQDAIEEAAREQDVIYVLDCAYDINELN